MRGFGYLVVEVFLLAWSIPAFLLDGRFHESTTRQLPLKICSSYEVIVKSVLRPYRLSYFACVTNTSLRQIFIPTF